MGERHVSPMSPCTMWGSTSAGMCTTSYWWSYMSDGNMVYSPWVSGIPRWIVIILWHIPISNISATCMLIAGNLKEMVVPQYEHLLWKGVCDLITEAWTKTRAKKTTIKPSAWISSQFNKMHMIVLKYPNQYQLCKLTVSSYTSMHYDYRSFLFVVLGIPRHACF